MIFIQEFVRVCFKVLQQHSRRQETKHIPRYPTARAILKNKNIASLCWRLAVEGLLLFAGSSFAAMYILCMVTSAAVSLVTQDGALGLLSLIVSLSFIELPQLIPNY